MLKHLSSPLLLVALTLMGVGVVQVYSSSFIFAADAFHDGHYFFARQALYVAIGFVSLLVAAQVPIKNLIRWGWIFWLIAGACLIATFLPGIGVRVGGAIRWIQLPFGLRFEPAELLKFSFPFLFASWVAREETKLAGANIFWWLVLLVSPLLLLLKQPDFGSFAIICLVAFGLLFSFGLKWKYIISTALASVPIFYFLVMQVPYRRARVIAFLDPWSDPEQKGFQVIQSMLSFSNGGIFGTGLGRGLGKLFFLPEAHTDFTLAVLGEEVGFIGFIIVMALYGFVVIRGFQIAMRCENTYLKALSLGLTLNFGLSVFINCGVVMGLLPTKGLTLPFLSYGGSSLVAVSLLVGVLINIERSTSKHNDSSSVQSWQNVTTRI